MFYNTSKKIILASASPRRRQFLEELNLEFESRVREIDESYPENLKGKDIALHISENKAAAFDDLGDDEVLICSDTVVWCDGKALGKPNDKAHAAEMLEFLSGKTHEVITAFTIKSKEKTISDYSTTRVKFKNLEPEEIDYYIDNYKPFDKAGSYGIQEWIGLIGIEKIEGSYFNVVGLPTDKLYNTLKKFL